MKKILLSIILFFLFSSVSYAGPCLTTIASASTNQLACADDDILNVTSAGSITYNDNKAVDLEDISGVQITNDGTIQTEDGTNKQKAIHAESSLNTTITNNGTINSDNNEGIILDYAENVIITNNAGATISAEGNNAISGKNVGNCHFNGTNCHADLSGQSNGVGLTLYNYGTITSAHETIWLGSGASGNHRSKGLKIYNYDGGIIKTTGEGDSPIKAFHLVDFEFVNYKGGTIEGADRHAVNTEQSEDVNFTNHGTITAADKSAFYCKTCPDTTFINTGTMSGGNNTVVISHGDNISVTNSGTITATGANSGLSINQSDGAVVTNTGTISGVRMGMQSSNVDNSTITNYGTISASANLGYGILYENDGTNRVNNTLNNYGTISATSGSFADGIGIGRNATPMFNITINNYGTISGSDDSIKMLNSSNTGINIVTKDEGTYVGEINLNDSSTTMTLDCSISKDQKIEIHNKTNMVVTNNLCGNDTYEILDSNSDPDADNSETNGFLYVYGEDLDIDSHNKKYRSEIFLSNLNDIFNSVSEEKKSSGYYSVKKRDNIYKNETTGVTGDFKIENDNFTPFLSYSSQQAKFNNGEALDSENLAIGLKKEIDYEKFKFSVVSIFGLTQNKYLDLETETKQTISKENLGQFAAVNYRASKEIEIDDSQSLNIEVDGKYGLRRLPTYLSSFTDGDLSVDDAVDQVLSGGFNVEYSKSFENGFVLKPYTGLSLNQTLSEKIDIVADGERKDMAHYMDDDLAVKAGLNISKNTDDFGLNFNLEFNEQNGLKDSQVSISLTKVIQNNISKKIEGLPIDPELENLFDQLQLAKENERLAKIAGQATEENRVMKEMIMQLIKENNKLKTERNLLLKN